MEGFFTKALNKKLGDRAAQTWRDPPYVTDIHAHVAAAYRDIIPEKRLQERSNTNLPVPFHMLVAGENTPRSSIQLTPRSQSKPLSRRKGRNEAPEVIVLRFFGTLDEDRESLNEWLRMRPGKVQVKTEGYDEHERLGSSSSELVPA